MLLNAAVAVVGLRVVGDADWGLYFRVAQSWVVFVGISFVMDSGRVAFVWLPIVVMTSVASLYGVRRGVPFVFIAVALAVGAALLTNIPNNEMIAVIVGTAILAVGVALLIVQAYVRGLARENARLAETDELTGVANMRNLRARLIAQLRPQTSGNAEPFALFAIDLDEFKRVNDEFDHGLGDTVLREVATELAAVVEPTDLVARRGGDEFSVLAPNAANRDLEGLAADLESAISRARTRVCPQITPSGSVGYAICSEKDELPDVLARADDALHAAKLTFRRRSGTSATRRMPVAGGFTPSSGCENAQPRKYAGGYQQRLVWRLATVLFATAAVLTSALTAIASNGMQIATYLGAGALLAALAWWTESSRMHSRSLRLLEPTFVAALVLVTAAVAVSGDAIPATVNLLLLLAVFAFILFDSRFAWTSAVGGLAAMVALLVFTETQYVAMTIACNVFVVLASASIVEKVRSVTKRFIRLNLELSERDALTGVANLRALRARVTNAIEVVSDDDPLLAVIAFDLDDFKSVNELRSHTVGDSVLVAAAGAMQECARDGDMVARRGGDEFYVVTERTQPTDVKILAARMATAIAIARERVCPELAPTASFAVATFAAGDDTAGLLEKADVALHESKAASHRARAMRLIA